MTGQYFIDSLDLWTTFNIGVESGSDDFLKIPPRKESITRNWKDDDGVEVDLHKTFFEAREVNMRLFSANADKATFETKYNDLIAVLRSPGLRRLTVTRHNKDYMVYYKQNAFYQSFNYFVLPRGRILAKFILTLVEPSPNLQGSGNDGSGLPPFIVDHTGKFLIA